MVPTGESTNSTQEYPPRDTAAVIAASTSTSSFLSFSLAPLSLPRPLHNNLDYHRQFFIIVLPSPLPWRLALVCPRLSYHCSVYSPSLHLIPLALSSPPASLTLGGTFFLFSLFPPIGQFFPRLSLCGSIGHLPDPILNLGLQLPPPLLIIIPPTVAFSPVQRNLRPVSLSLP